MQQLWDEVKYFWHAQNANKIEQTSGSSCCIIEIILDAVVGFTYINEAHDSRLMDGNSTNKAIVLFIGIVKEIWKVLQKQRM